jgi:hypothetical protein
VVTVRGYSRPVGMGAGTEKPNEKPRHRDDGDGAMLVTPTGLESAATLGTSRTLLAAPDLGPSCTLREDVLDRPDPSGLPSAVPSFLEACASLASQAAAHGDFERAKVLIEKAAQVARLVPRKAG